MLTLSLDPSFAICNAVFTRARHNPATLVLRRHCILPGGPQAKTHRQGLRPVSFQKVQMRRLGLLHEMQSGQHSLRISVGLQQCHFQSFARADSVGYSNLRRPPVRPYSSSFTELLLQREPQLVLGLQRMYHRLVEASAWNGPPLTLVAGQPLTHDILSALNVLDPKPGSESPGKFPDTVLEDDSIPCSPVGNFSCTQPIGLTYSNEDCRFTEQPTTEETDSMPRRRASATDTTTSSSSYTQPPNLTHSNKEIWISGQPTTYEMRPPPRRSASLTDTTASSESCNTQPANVTSCSPPDTNRALQPRTPNTTNPELTHLPNNIELVDQATPCFRTLDDPMFAILGHHAYPVFRTLDDPMFATLADDGGIYTGV